MQSAQMRARAFSARVKCVASVGDGAGVEKAFIAGVVGVAYALVPVISIISIGVS